MLTLAEIAAVTGATAEGVGDRATTGASIDSRTIEPGMIFFALKGNQEDGHNFIRAAFDRGASAAVVERQYQAYEGSGPLFYVSSVLEALGMIAGVYRKKLGIPIIGVTGSNGKTTTKEMIARILSVKYRIEKSEGNLNNHIGVPLTVMNWRKKADIGVLEMGTNHFGEIRHLCKMIEPTHGLITNIGKGHLEFFKDMDGVLKAKKEILEELPDEGVAFLNGDDSRLRSVRFLRQNTILFGFSHECSFRGEHLSLNERGCATFRIESETIHVPVPGRHQAMNALAACAVASHFHVPLKMAGDALRNFSGADRRMEIMEIGGIVILNDAYNANPSSMFEALATLQAIRATGRRIAVLGDMMELGDREEEEHSRLGEWIAEMGIHALFACGRAMEAAVRAANHKGMKDARIFRSKSDLEENLQRYIMNGDVILFKGSRGMSMESVIDFLKKSRGSL